MEQTKTSSSTFENLALTEDDYKENRKIKIRSDRFIIAEGDSVRFKAVFDSRAVVKITAENGACTTPDDLKKGMWIVTLKPEKTRWCSIKEYSSTGFIHEAGTRIIVVKRDKYDEVIARLKKLKGRELGVYIDSVAGGNFNKFVPRFEYSRWK